MGCHREILAGRFAAPPAALRRWQQHLQSLRVTPSLAGAGRLRRDWLARFLLAPHDVRPHLPASMPRLPLGPAAAEALARHLVAREAPDDTFADSDISRGRVLFGQLGCASCHAFSGARTPAPNARAPVTEAVALAPDLRHARTRLQSGLIVALLADPRASMPGTAMPPVVLPPADLRALAAFVLRTPLEAASPRPPPRRLPILRRRVRFAEVSAKVFRRTCWHCHAEPDLARGDGGPGFSGGFGYPARGLDLSSHEGVLSGALDESGERQSVFRPRPDGTPELLARLVDRWREEAGEPPGAPAMPLGFPALTPAEIQLVETWIAQGRRR